MTTRKKSLDAPERRSSVRTPVKANHQVAEYNYFAPDQIPMELHASLDSLHRAALTSSASNYNSNPEFTVFEALSMRFGFQAGNVANQKEHVAILLTNMKLRFDNNANQALQHLHRRVFANYGQWCRFLNERQIYPGGQQGLEQQLALYFLIWGEAANCRFLPECLCFLYHVLARRLGEMLEDPAIESSQPPGSFLHYVVTPVYHELGKMKSKYATGKFDHDKVRNYDDMNEFFWTRACLVYDETNVAQGLASVQVKTFCERRSIFSPLLAFFRIYYFLLVSLHALVAIAFVAYSGAPNETSGLGFYANFFSIDTFDLRVHAIFCILISVSTLSVLKIVLEIWMDGILLFRHNGYVQALVCRLVWHTLFAGIICTVGVSPYTTLLSTETQLLDLAPVIATVYCFPIFLASFSDTCVFGPLKRSILGKCLRHMVNEYTQPTTAGIPARQRFQYTLFWIVVYALKFSFSLQLMIVPLIGPSVEIYNLGRVPEAVEGPFESPTNTLLLVALWAPVLCVYLYDTQIWFTILQALVGLVQNWVSKRTQNTNHAKKIVSYLKDAPTRFNKTIVSTLAREIDGLNSVSSVEAQDKLRFAVVWNECVTSFRYSDLIDDREGTILKYAIEEQGTVQDPVFIHAGKITRAMEVTQSKKKTGKNRKTSRQWHKTLSHHECASTVVMGFQLWQDVMSKLLGSEDMAVVQMLEQIASDPAAFVDIGQLYRLYDPLVDLLGGILDLPEMDDQSPEIISALMTRFAHLCHVAVDGILLDAHMKVLVDELVFGHVSNSEMLYQRQQLNGFYQDAKSMHDCTRLFLLLSLDMADALPRCPEAQRRLAFFLSSLEMDMPVVASIKSMASFSVVTPYFNETVMYSLEELHTPVKANSLFTKVDDLDERGELTILKYLATCHPLEWVHFLERIDLETMDEALELFPDEVRLWASNRGQTLARTIQGMMLYEDALKMLRWLEIGSDASMSSDQKLAEMDAITKLKFTYITSCQIYAQQKRDRSTKALDIEFLLHKYPNWRVSYMDEIVCTSRSSTRYDVVLCKSDVGEDIVDVYRYALPGNPILGEGKPENQNLALQFTRGEYVQTIDMNQEHYFEEALKMPHFLATAASTKKSRDSRTVAILGMKEHIFTARASSLARFMTLQEFVFVSLNQKVLADPLESRMHYGHPDVFDKLFIMTQGSVSKASKGVNLSEDVFGGFNAALRNGRVIHNDFMLCGKGRDVSLGQINQFEAKLANGSAESSLSRESHRLGKWLDFPRLNAVYFGHMGFYVCTWLTVAGVFLYAYAKVYVGLHTSTETQLIDTSNNLNYLSQVLNTQFIFQFGLLMTLPLFTTILSENGLRVALTQILELFLTLGPVFYVFETGTKAHYFDIALLRGGSKYRGTGRGFIITRERFVTFFKEYAASHYRKGVELIALMTIFGLYGTFDVGKGALAEFCLENDCDDVNISLPPRVSLLETYSEKGQDYGVASFAVWFLGVVWILAPFFFNTDGLQFSKTKVDVKNWLEWMFYSNKRRHRGHHQFQPLDNGTVDENMDDGWTHWWLSTEAGLVKLTWMGRLAVFLREFRHFFIMLYIFLVDFDYADVYWLGIAMSSCAAVIVILGWVFRKAKWCVSSSSALAMSLVYGSSIVLSLVTIFAVLTTLSLNNHTLDEFQFRSMVSLGIATLAGLYGVLQYLLALDGVFNMTHVSIVEELQFFFDMAFGLVIATPFLMLSALPFMDIIQTRMMYNDGFSKALSTSGQYAASISMMTGLVGGLASGWLTAALFSLGFINDPSDFFQNTNFVYFVNQKNDDDDFDESVFDQLNMILALASALGIVIAGCVLKSLGRRASLISGVLLTLAGVLSLYFVDSSAFLVLASLCLTGAGVAMLVMSIVLYNFEINTGPWKGKGVLIVSVGAMVGYVVEASIVLRQNEINLGTDWAEATIDAWKYQFFYGAIPLALLLPFCFWIPESPVWLCCRTSSVQSNHHRAVERKAKMESVLQRLRQKHDIFYEVETLEREIRGQKVPGTTTSGLLPRLAVILLLQLAFAMLNSSSLWFRLRIQNRQDDPEGSLASEWQFYFGLMSFFALFIGLFIIDSIRRKTILKDILPLVVLISVTCGTLASLDVSASSSFIQGLLLLLFFMASLSLGSVTWLSAVEMLNPAQRHFCVPLSFAVYYLAQALVYATTPGFALSHFVFAGLNLVLILVLFLACASTTSGAIRLKSEKKAEKQLADEMRYHRSYHNRSHLRAYSERSSFRVNSSRTPHVSPPTSTGLGNLSEGISLDQTIKASSPLVPQDGSSSYQGYTSPRLRTSKQKQKNVD